MNRIAFIFSHSPYGNTSAQEGLDMLLSVTSITDNTDIFFISDGVLLLLSYQNSEEIFSKNVSSYFNTLLTHDSSQFYACIESLEERNLNNDTVFLVKNIKYFSISNWKNLINNYNVLLKF